MRATCGRESRAQIERILRAEIKHPVGPEFINAAGDVLRSQTSWRSKRCFAWDGRAHYQRMDDEPRCIASVPTPTRKRRIGPVDPAAS